MDLQEFESALPKPWLNIRANSVETNHVTFIDQKTPPNPPNGEHRLFFNATGFLSSVDKDGNVVVYAIVTKTPSINMLGYNTLFGPQLGADLLVGLSTGSTKIIPANTLKAGDVYRLKIRLNANAVVLTTGAIDFGTVAAGVMQVFDISTTTIQGNYVNTPIECSLDMMVTGPSHVNISASISVCAPSSLTGPTQYFGNQSNTPDVPVDTTIDQTLVLTYLTPAFVSATFSEILFYKVSNVF